MKNNYANIILPSLLSTAVLSSAAYIYSCGDTLICTSFILAAAVYNAVLFLIFEFLRKFDKKIITTLVLGVMFTLAMAAGGVLNDLPGIGVQIEWFMDPHKFNQIYTGGIAQIIIIFGLILGSAMFYFTVIQFRTVYIFLICMCPFCLFAKTFTDIPILYTVIISTLFFIMLMVSSNSGKSSFKMSKGGFAALVGFTAVVTIISAFYPKLEFAPYREDFDELITGIQIGAASSGNYNDFSNSSSNINIKNDEENERILYRIYGDAPKLIKRQCFNIYNGETDLWEYYGDYNNGYRIWKNLTLFENPEELYQITGNGDSEVKIKECVIKSEKDGIKALYSAENTTDISFEEKSRNIVYRTELSEFFVINQEQDYPESYKMTWVDFDINPAFSEQFTDEAAMLLAQNGVNEAVSYIEAKEEALRYNDYILSENVRKSCYNSENAFEKIKTLTREITENCKNDYYKAKAIEDYFHSDIFIYDDNFSTADASPENFIFNTRRGVCSDYAAAMTLMCREAGLTARYVEGFSCSEYDEKEQCWLLRVKDAHAYVQVWIDGYGWTDFNPTSGNIDDGYYNAVFVYIGIIAGIVVLIVISAVVLIPVMKKADFVSKLRKSDLRTGYILTYNKLIELYSSFSGLDAACLTPTEFKDKCLNNLNIDLSSFIDSYSRCVYGSAEAEEIDFAELINRFNNTLKEKERSEKKNRKPKKKM